MNVVNGYILYRLIVDNKEKPRRHSVMPTIYDHTQLSPSKQKSEPFCSPIAPHVPIRQRLSSRRCTSVDASNEADQFVLSASNPYLSGRRRRMSLLQTLRYQNKQLADSGFECHQSDKAERDLASPSALLQKRYSESPPSSPVEEEAEQKLSSSSFTKLKAKTKALFAKKGEKKSHMLEQRGDISSDVSSRCGPSENERAIYSCIDFTAKEKAQRKSPSINDSGRGSQGRLCPDDEHPEDTAEHERERNDRRETVAVIERTPLEGFMNRISKSAQLRRSISCPQLGLNLRIYHEILHRTISVRNHGNSLDSDTDEEDEDDFECSARDVRQRLCERDQQIVRGTPSLRSEKSEEAEGIVEKEEVKFAERMFRNSSPLSAADFLLEKRLRIRALLMQRQQEANATSEESLKQSNDSGTPNSLPKQMSGPSFSTFSAESVHAAGPADEMNNNDELTAKLEKVALAEADTRSTGTHASEELDEDDNASTILLDQYLPIISELYPQVRNRSQHSSSQSSVLNRSEEDDEVTVRGQGKVGIITQTDLSLIRISEQLSAYLTELGLTGADEELTNDKQSSQSLRNSFIMSEAITNAFWWRQKSSSTRCIPESFTLDWFYDCQRRSRSSCYEESKGMNFLAKHFFEYQSFINLPHKAVQLHKTPPSQAGSDPSASWAPKSMNKAGKNQAAPGARANRNNTDTRPAAHRHGRAGKHEYREWGDRHGELKPEKIVPHKDAWTKFLSNEEAAGKRTLFECDFEDRILQTEPETLPERLSRTEKNGDVDFSIAHPGTSNPANACETEVLTILTYAPQVQFVTATVKKAKCLPFNNHPFARVMLFEGRRLLEQKQTTITPTVTCNGCVSTGSRPKPACSNSSTSSSSVSSGSAKSNDAIFSESFLFHVSPQMLDRCHIVIEMYDSNPEDPDKGPFPIGHCVVGPMCAGTGCAHWFQMIRKNSLPVCMWHRMTKN